MSMNKSDHCSSLDNLSAFPITYFRNSLASRSFVSLLLVVDAAPASSWQLLPDVHATEDDQQPEEPSTYPAEDPTSPIEQSETQDPAQVQVDHHQPAAPSNDPPVIIAPSGYT